MPQRNSGNPRNLRNPRNLASMFEPGYDPQFAEPTHSEDADVNAYFDDNDAFMFAFDDDANSQQSDVEREEKKKRRKQQKKEQGKHSEKRKKSQKAVMEVSSSSSSSRKRVKPAPDKSLPFDPKDMRTWKFARHRPNARRFRSGTVVGPVYVKRVKRDTERERVTVWGQKYLDFGGFFIQRVQSDELGEFFYVYESIDDEENERNGRKIRPNTPAECDADVGEAYAQHEKTQATSREAEEQRELRAKEAEAQAREKRRQDAREAMRAREPETLHVGDIIKLEHPTVRTTPKQWVHAQVLSMRDVSGKVPWRHPLDWTFSGVYASLLTAGTMICIVKKKSGEPVVNSRWMWPLGSYLLPSAYEPPMRESDEQRRLRETMRRVRRDADDAVADYMSGRRDETLLHSPNMMSATAAQNMYPNLRF